MNLSKGNLRLLEDQGRFLLERRTAHAEDYEGLSFTTDELRWLIFWAGPAMIHDHTPVPASPESRQRTPLPPWDPPAINPGQLEIE